MRRVIYKRRICFIVDCALNLFFLLMLLVNCLDGLIIKTKWSGEAETGELSLCVEYGNSTCTPLEPNDKRFYTLVLHAIIHTFLFFLSKHSLQTLMCSERKLQSMLLKFSGSNLFDLT